MKNKGAILALFLVFGSTTFNSAAQNQIWGKWKTIDDNTGETKSVVEIYSKNDKLFGKVISLFPQPGEDPDPVCDKCSDQRYNQKIIGMNIITDMEQDDDEWAGGKILDPENGNIYRCRLWVENGKLKVRGYLVFFFRTQTWIRAR